MCNILRLLKKYWHFSAIILFLLLHILCVITIAPYALYNDYTQTALLAGFCYLLCLFVWLLLIYKSQPSFLGIFTCYFGLFWAALSLLTFFPKPHEIFLIFSLLLLFIGTPFATIRGALLYFNQIFSLPALSWRTEMLSNLLLAALFIIIGQRNSRSKLKFSFLLLLLFLFGVGFTNFALKI